MVTQVNPAVSKQGSVWFCLLGDILTVTLQGGEQGRVYTPGLEWVAAREATKHPTMHRAAPTTKIIQLTISSMPRLRSGVSPGGKPELPGRSPRQPLRGLGTA